MNLNLKQGTEGEEAHDDTSPSLCKGNLELPFCSKHPDPFLEERSDLGPRMRPRHSPQSIRPPL
jgi:hypothetical protein